MKVLSPEAVAKAILDLHADSTGRVTEAVVGSGEWAR